MFNLALGFTILLSAMALLLFKSLPWVTPVTFCGTTLVLFILLRFTSCEHYIKPSKLVHWVFGIANTLIFTGFAIFSLGTNAGANGIGAAMFVGLYFFVPGSALLLCGSIVLAVQSIKANQSRR